MYAEETVQTTQEHQHVCGLPVDTRALFSDEKGVYSRRIESRKTELLQNITFLNKFLDPDEHIVFVTTGRSLCSTMEQMTPGWTRLDTAKRALLVFTNHRLFHIPTTWGYRYRGSIAQIPYHGCSRLHVEGASLVVEYDSRRKDRFSPIPRRDRAIISRVVANLCGSAGACDSGTDGSLGRTHLCPSCTHMLTHGVWTCPSCGLEFKTEMRARLHTLVIPGGGYIYTNHFFMGILDACVETYLIGLILLSAGAMYLGNRHALAPFGVALVCLLVEKLIVIYHAIGFVAEFLPKNLEPILAQPNVPAQPPAEPPMPQQQRQPEEALSVR